MPALLSVIVFAAVDIIVSDQLYAVNLQAGGEGGVSADVKGFLQQTGVETETGRKKTDAQASKESPAKAAARQAEPAEDRIDRRKQRHTAARAGHGSEMVWVDALMDQTEVGLHLSGAFRWDFNLFELDAKSSSHPVITIVLHLVRTLDLDEQLPINMGNLMKFLTVLEEAYLQPPFHTRLHAADCTHGTAYFLLQPKLRQHFSSLDLYSLILAGVMHDCAHPGYSNAFLVNSRHELAILYNDSSVRHANPHSPPPTLTSRYCETAAVRVTSS